MCFLAILSTCQIFSVPQYLIIIRHGEKNPNDTVVKLDGEILYTTTGKPMMGQHLSPRGESRAHALPYLLCEEPFVSTYGKIFAIYAPHPNDKYQSVRPIYTAKPTADLLELQINFTYDLQEYDKLIEKVMQAYDYKGKTIFIAWEHAHIPGLLKAFCSYFNTHGWTLTGDKVPTGWPSTQFDKLCIFVFDAKTKEVKFEFKPQQLLFGDSKAINKKAVAVKKAVKVKKESTIKS